MTKTPANTPKPRETVSPPKSAAEPDPDVLRRAREDAALQKRRDAEQAATATKAPAKPKPKE